MSVVFPVTSIILPVSWFHASNHCVLYISESYVTLVLIIVDIFANLIYFISTEIFNIFLLIFLQQKCQHLVIEGKVLNNVDILAEDISVELKVP